MSITNNKNQNSLLDLLIDCMSAESAPKIMSLKDEYNLNFSNFLILACVILQLIIGLA